MFKNILVPLDGSKVAEKILAHVRFFATGLQLPVDLLHVRDRESSVVNRPLEYLQTLAAAVLPHVMVRCHVAEGAAAAVIVDRAAADSGTLIAIATHGESGGGRWLLGRVAQKVLHATGNPLLLWRPGESERRRDEVTPGKVIVPLDGSQLAEQVLPHVLSVSRELTLAVTLVRAYTLPTAAYFMAAGIAPAEGEGLREKIKDEAEKYLANKAAELRSLGAGEVAFEVTEGKGPEEIISLARRTPGSLVAMSSHGRSGIGRWVMGSVADRVVSNAGVPVLVVRAAA